MAQKKFVYDLPYSVRKRLCQLLDAIDKWEELGEHMGFDYTYLQYIRRKDSPTDELLTSWGNKNPTVNYLFVLLSKMQNYRAMLLLKDYVEEQYHHLIKEGEEMMSQPQTNKNMEDEVRPNRAFQRQNGADYSHVVEEPSTRALRPSAASPDTFEDNKDLGLDVHNMNLAVKKPQEKMNKNTAGNEVKIQNLPDERERQNVNQNVNGHNMVNCQSQAAYNPNLSPQLESFLTQKPTQERKLSNVSVTSSVMEGCTPHISYEELEAATNGWGTANILGRGGFGTVYKGTWKSTLVAIKKLDSQKNERMQTSELNASQMNQSLRELKYLNSHRHDNILSLYGYSITEGACCLVYQYMANGSLEDRLHRRQNTSPLSWGQRLNIMTGTARGIQFLHSLGKKPLVHGDIKSANILLDSNFEPRLGDFGLAREGPLEHYTHIKVSRVHGTRPYLPDEFLRGKKFSTKVDTYSFGVVLFEVATGLRAYDENRKEKFLKDHVLSYLAEELGELADPQAGRDDCASAAGLLTLGRDCVSKQPRGRPEMTIVLNNLDMLHKNYLCTEHDKCLARQGSLTPTNPLQMQIKHDVQRNQQFVDPFSQQVLLFNGSTPPIHHGFPIPQPVYFAPGTSDNQRFPMGDGNVQVLPRIQTGLPQTIIIHHPPTVMVQPASESHPDSPSQADKLSSALPPENTVYHPRFSVLGIKHDVPGKQSSVSTNELSVQEGSTQDSSSMSLSSMSKLELQNNSQHEPTIDHPDTSSTAENQSTYLPMISDLLDH